MLDEARAAALHSTLARLDSIALDPEFFQRRRRLGWSRAETNRAIKLLLESGRAVVVADGETVVIQIATPVNTNAGDNLE